ncbi:MAG: CBS domain-containing protein [Thermoleophilaceae bacterium]
MPRSLAEQIQREVPILRADQEVGAAVRQIIDAKVAALPVVDDRGRLAGIFGEREFITAAFPGYLRELKYAAFVSQAAEDALELRRECELEPVGDHMNTEHVDVPSDYSDAQIAEIFLHHRVLIVPIADGGEVRGIITRWDFFKAIADRVLEAPAGS